MDNLFNSLPESNFVAKLYRVIYTPCSSLQLHCKQFSAYAKTTFNYLFIPR